MDTGVSVGTRRQINSIDQNARVAAGYISALRSDLNAWQVDLVGHSMGGLISRRYIAFDMPLATVTNMPRPVRHLIMLGTPNLGSPCADVASGFLFMSTADLQTSTMASFNKATSNLRGVPASILASDLLPFTCFAKGPGDGVVPVPSAYYNFTDRGLAHELHTDMPSSQADFTQFVLPRLAVTRGAAPAAVPAPAPARVASVRPQAAAKTPATDGIGMGQAQPGKTKVLAFDLARGEKVLALVLGTGGYNASLKGPNGKTVTADYATSGPMGTLSPASAPGHWTLTVLAGSTPAEYQVVVSGSPVHLATTATTGKAKGTAIVSTRVTGYKSMPKQTVVSASITGSNGKARKVVLFDDGKHGDGKARDGVYGAQLTKWSAGKYFIDVSAAATGQKFLRIDSQSLTIR
jgi:pimeloyl-ACP methyl ester carboxylesterase